MKRPSRQPVSPALLSFVLRHTRMRTARGSLQKSEIGSFNCPQRTISDTNLIFVTRGRVAWYVEDREHILTPGTLLLSPRDVPHHAESRSRRLTLLSMHLIPTLPGGQDAFDLLRPPVVQIIQRGTRLDGYLHAAMTEYKRGDGRMTELALRHWANLVFLELMRHDADAGLLEARPFDPIVGQVLDALGQRIAITTTLADLARISGYTPQHLNRLFRRTLGVTPLQHLTHLRMRRAAELLRDRDLSLTAVAAAVAIEDPYYFSRLFKQHHGVSPTGYRAAVDSDSPS